MKQSEAPEKKLCALLDWLYMLIQSYTWYYLVHTIVSRRVPVTAVNLWYDMAEKCVPSIHDVAFGDRHLISFDHLRSIAARSWCTVQCLRCLFLMTFFFVFWKSMFLFGRSFGQRVPFASG